MGCANNETCSPVDPSLSGSTVENIWLHSEVVRLVDDAETWVKSGQGRIAHRIGSFLRFSGILNELGDRDLSRRVDLLTNQASQCPDFVTLKGGAPGLADLSAQLKKALELVDGLQIVERGRTPWEYLAPSGEIRACAWCQKEFQVPVEIRRGDSPGVCPRHREELARDVVQHNQARN